MEAKKSIIKCLNELKNAKEVTDAWWTRWYWCREKISCSSRIGDITIQEALKYEAFLKKLEERAKKLRT